MSNEALTLEQIQADPRAVIQAGLEWHPDIWWGGLFDWRFERTRTMNDGTTPAQRLALRREATLDERGVGQLLRAAEFIAWAPRIKSLNRGRGTYGWKHVAERFHKVEHPGTDYYVGEGAFIIAARAMGLAIAPTGHGHYYVSLSEKVAKEINKRKEEWERQNWGRAAEQVTA
jgi:hypothetical protein